MDISFIIPAYNEAKGIVATLQQFQQLSGVQFEVIVSDNGSDDATVELSTQHGAKVALRPGTERTSIGECRNRGARIATGKLLWFIDADVRIEKIQATVEHVLRLYQQNPKLVAAPLRITIYKEEATFWDKLIYILFNATVYVQNVWLNLGASPGDVMTIQRSAFEQVHGFRPELKTAEDFELFSRLAKVGRVGYFWNLTIGMSPRRIHRDGWPKVLWQWFKNWFNQVALGKVSQGDWEARR